MKRVIYTLCFLYGIGNMNAQQASDYFPDQTGFMWSYMVTPLDSSNNQIDSLIFFRQDSFAVTTNYEGKLANVVLTKSGPKQSILFQPYTDSLYLHFLGTDGYEYFEFGVLGEFLTFLDSIITFNNFSFVDFINSLEDWYSVYRFTDNVNEEYTLFSIDTTVTNDTLDIPLRFEYLGERLEDDTITTAIGTFGCKKFLIQQGVSILIILPPPLPPAVIPVAFEKDTVWIAEGNWIVQDIIPTTHIDLSFIGIEPFFIPGIMSELIDPNIIPVELTSFTAVSETGKVRLTWSTATETNNFGFQIERSDESKHFEQIGFVHGSGTTTESQEYTFVDKTAEIGIYYYRLKQVDFDGQYEYSNIVEVEIVLTEFALFQNYPNPFNPSTTIKYQIPELNFVTLKVYDVLGNEIITLVNEKKPIGNYEIEFNAPELPSGIYFYSLQAGNYVDTKKMILLK